MRVNVDDECATYETEKWVGLEDQHFVWSVILDEHVI